jgi:hypothetical protein
MKYALKILASSRSKSTASFLAASKNILSLIFSKLQVKFFFEMPNGLEDVGNISLIQRRF